ncbi:DUF885 domain-containing protein [Mucilaginibacter koreensis]
MSSGPQLTHDDAAFARYEENFLDALWKLQPTRATETGYHKYDSLLIAPDAGYIKKQVNFARAQADSLSHYEGNKLSESNKIDYHLIQDETDKMLWELQTLKEYEWNPTYYNLIGTFAYMLNEKYAPLNKRLTAMYQRMAFVPAYYKEAQKQVKNPVPEFTQLAIEQLNGSLSILDDNFADSLKKSTLPAAEQTKMLERAKLAVQAIKGYTGWLQTLKNDRPRSFRLGRQLYVDKFKYNIQSQSTPQQVYNAAMERKKYLHREMAKISRKLWSKYFGTQAQPKDSLELIAEVIDTIASKHVAPAEFQSAIEKQIPKLTEFVKSKNLLTLDPTKPLIVRREPAYMAGVAGASVSAPGPYDKGGNTYFNVGSLNGWSAAKAESYLREYNNYTLQILCNHEAIPGHYTQLVYANQSPSLIKSVLGNGAMIEGWAVYSEQMMLEAGYGNDQPEMWLMWYKWNLRSVCNMILDYSVHTMNMSRQDALNLLTREAFQEQTEAENKWKRVTLSSVQLSSYYTGYKEIIDLREAYKKKQADKYKVKDFNEKFLSYGNAPVQYIRELMMEKKGD